MPSSKGGKEFVDENRYTIADRTRQKLDLYYRDAVDSLFKNFKIKF